jgi:hypothetical protein
MKKSFNEKQKKSRGSKARRLQILEKSENKYFINVKGFLGYVKSKINIPGYIFYENDKRNVPIYLISAHGEMFGGLRLSRHSIEKNIPIVEETRNGHLFNRTKKNQWIVHTAPVRSLICPSKFDGQFFKYLTENSIEVKNILFSKNPDNLYTNVVENKERMGPFKTANLSQPGAPYPRKNHTFYDNPNKKKCYDWPMGVYPIFNSHNAHINLFDNDEVTRYTKDYDIKYRIFNEEIMEKMDWRGKTKLKKKYEKLTNKIYESLPKYDKRQNKWGKGNDVTMKEIMDIMGDGIYISLTCSPFTNTYYDKIPIDNRVCAHMGEQVIEIVSRMNKKMWKDTYKNYRSKATLRKQKKKICKQEIMVDSDAPKFGKKNTGVGMSKKGRLIFTTKKVELNEKKTSSSSSSESDWIDEEED